jgi:hypothetical protein
MEISIELRKTLIEERGIYVTEACDSCTQLLGPVRFTRAGESGVWCSRGCRDGKEAHSPRTCKGCGAALPTAKRRGAAYCDDACRKAHSRVADPKLSRTKASIYAGFCTVSSPGSYPHSRKAENAIIADTNRP